MSRLIRSRLMLRPLEDRTLPTTFTVMNLNDSGADSLRDCISKANAASGADTVDFKAGLTGTITLTTGEIAISQGLTIVGPGSSQLSISGNNASRIFNTDPAPAAAAIAISGLTLVSGKAFNGGAILGGNESVTLNDSVITGNVAAGSIGGAFYMIGGGTLAATNCSFTNNTADLAGAIFNGGGKTILNSCTVSGNTAAAAGACYVTNYLLVENSTIANNSATATGSGFGGGIRLSGTFAAGALTIRNSTISGNSTPFRGGGIVMLSFTGNLVVQNSTITGNSAGNSIAGGGGISLQSGFGSISLESSIVSGNTNAAAPDIFSSQTVNVKTSAVGSNSGFTITDQGGNLAFGTNLQIGPLANNGGPTLTHAPTTKLSPLIDKGSNPATLTTDQRGALFPRVVNSVPDIGAVEGFVLLVTNTNDSGAGSLRQAILDANAVAGADTVSFSPTIFATPQTIKLTTGEIAINQALTVLGPAAMVTIDGNAKSRIFNTSLAAAGTVIVIQGVTLTNGSTTGSNFGSAIGSVDEALTLKSCVVTNCSAPSGGAIFVGGTLLIEDSTLTANKATVTDGGAIFVNSNGQVTIRRSTLSGNTAADSGGAIYFFNNGSLTVEDSTISGNTANSTNGFTGGGGIYFFGTATKFLISDSTLSGNSASAASGGAVCFDSFSGMAILQNTTITNNLAGVNGGGIAKVNGNGTVSLSSSIVAGNANTNTPDLSFSSASNVGGDNNLIGVADVGKFILTGSGNQSGTKAAPLDANLGPLADNGGPTFTHLPQSGSPVINKGNNAAGLTFDQRGSGFGRVQYGAADVGAVELLSTIPVASATAADVTAAGGTIHTINVQYFDDIGINTTSLGNPDITVNGPGGPISVTLTGFTGSGTSVAATYNMVPPGGTWDAGDNGTYSITMNANKVFDADAHSVPAGTIGGFTVVIAQTIVVNATNDESTDSDGKTSLREAILLANQFPGSADTVVFDPAVFGSPQTILQTLGQINVSESVIITGPATELTIDAGGLSRHFNIDGTGTLTVSISKMTLSNGNSVTGDGGSIRIADEVVNLSSINFTNNTAIGKVGGAVSMVGAGGQLIVQDCVFTANQATFGGAINVAGGASGSGTISRCTFSGNSTDSGGGAMYCANENVTITDCTLSGNTSNKTKAGNGGGAILFLGSGTLAVTNSTISGNTMVQASSGGGILLVYFTGAAVIQNSTITANNAVTAGGGIARTSGTGTVTLQSTIVAGNLIAGMNNAKSDLSFDAVSAVGGSNNLIGIQDGSNNAGLTGSFNQTGSLATPLDAKLGPLANNGGPTMTHALLADSPAIDKGNNSAGLSFDQRGAGFVRNFNGVDIGAFELQPVAPPTVTSILVNDSTNAERSLVTSIKVTFSESVNFPSGLGAAFSLIQGASSQPVGLVFNPANGPAATVTITFANGAIGLDPGSSLPDGKYLFTIVADKIAGVGGTLDGDGDAVAEGSPTDNKTLAFHRLFGDADGNGAVNSSDFATFRSFFGLGASIFDFNNDNQTNSNDFAEFRKRFGITLGP